MIVFAYETSVEFSQHYMLSVILLVIFVTLVLEFLLPDFSTDFDVPMNKAEKRSRDDLIGSRKSSRAAITQTFVSNAPPKVMVSQGTQTLPVAIPKLPVYAKTFPIPWGVTYSNNKKSSTRKYCRGLSVTQSRFMFDDIKLGTSSVNIIPCKVEGVEAFLCVGGLRNVSTSTEHVPMKVQTARRKASWRRWIRQAKTWKPAKSNSPRIQLRLS